MYIYKCGIGKNSNTPIKALWLTMPLHRVVCKVINVPFVSVNVRLKYAHIVLMHHGFFVYSLLLCLAWTTTCPNQSGGLCNATGRCSKCKSFSLKTKVSSPKIALHNFLILLYIRMQVVMKTEDFKFWHLKPELVENVMHSHKTGNKWHFV